MTVDRIKLCAIAAALAATLTGEAYGQTTGSPGISSPTPPGAPGLTSGSVAGQPGVASPAPAGTKTGAMTPGAPQPADSGRARNDPTAPQTPGPASTQLQGQRGLSTGAQTQGNTNTNPGGGVGYTDGAGISGGVPAMGGVTPSRAELPGSAFTKLDAASRGYVTLEDVRQLDGFESAFRQADQNGDGRLNASEFNSAWGTYTGNVR
jgi:hypothetical protein